MTQVTNVLVMTVLIINGRCTGNDDIDDNGTFVADDGIDDNGRISNNDGTDDNVT
jgi:hypothetical protein